MLSVLPANQDASWKVHSTDGSEDGNQYLTTGSLHRTGLAPTHKWRPALDLMTLPSALSLSSDQFQRKGSRVKYSILEKPSSTRLKVNDHSYDPSQISRKSVSRYSIQSWADLCSGPWQIVSIENGNCRPSLPVATWRIMPEIESSFSYFSGQDIVVYAKIMIFIQIPCLIQFLFIFLQHYHGKKETETLIDFKLQKWGIRQNKPLSLI